MPTSYSKPLITARAGSSINAAIASAARCKIPFAASRRVFQRCSLVRLRQQNTARFSAHHRSHGLLSADFQLHRRRNLCHLQLGRLRVLIHGNNKIRFQPQLADPLILAQAVRCPQMKFG
ncbi:MAG: hypothetical protein P8Y45_22030 [Exilibacterium sp.]